MGQCLIVFGRCTMLASLRLVVRHVCLIVFGWFVGSLARRLDSVWVVRHVCLSVLGGSPCLRDCVWQLAIIFKVGPFALTPLPRAPSVLPPKIPRAHFFRSGPVGQNCSVVVLAQARSHRQFKLQ